jgi:two-component system phosphate regulon sensor histidine kinase PhoR
MEKRIRIVWILSLASALLLIGVQGYWLYNQYQYVIDGYSQELSEQILNAGEKEYQFRKSDTKTTFMFTQLSYPDGNNSAKKQLSISIASRDSLLPSALNMDFISERKLKILQDSPKHLNSSSIELNNTAPPDSSSSFMLSFDANLSNDSLQAGINRATTNFNNPFQIERFDSILHADIPDIQYKIIPWTEKEPKTYFSGWEQCGNLFSPGILVSYSYSPLEKKGIYIQVSLPPQPVFHRMAIQLALALGLILLLIGCLVFQIKTILKQKKLSELRESFVNTMIHELKRPVQTLKTFVSFLGDKELRTDETATEQVLQDSMFELDNLSVYLNKLKDMVRADNETTLLHPVKFNLQELMEKVVRLAYIPAGKEVKISTVYEIESPWIEADAVHIANILGNLIENAVKYSGTQVDIELKAKREGKELWLTVTDNGIGIPFAEQEKVFTKFYRGTNLPDKNIPGIGLGLSYVKLIIEAHHGNVLLDSRIGEGTSVILYLPQ